MLDTIRAAVQLSRVTRRRPRPQLVPVEGLIPRIGASITDYGLIVVRHYQARGTILTASARGITMSRDKRLSQRLFSSAGLPVPTTLALYRVEELLSGIEKLGGFPVVLKQASGTQGRGVVLLNNLQATEAIADAWHLHRKPLLLQEFIPEAGGRDIRVIVVGNQCVATMQRQASAGDFRANLHLGGQASPVALDPSLEKLALRAAETLSLAVAGIDIIESARGPLLLEANSSPGLEGIEKTTGRDVAGAIITYLEERADVRDRRRRSRSRRRSR
jgi:ribosomal protein S6--L-glutamate ligase